MALLVDQIIRLLSASEGNLIYSLVLGFCAFSTWLSCLYAKGKQVSPEGNRMQFGLLILILVQLALFGATWLAWLRVIDAHLYLPPLFRTLALFSLVLIIWLWVFPKPNIAVDALVTLVGAIIVLLGATSMILWLREGSGSFFNTSMIGGYAYYSGLGFLVIGGILLLGLRPSFWGYGLLTLLIFFTGYLAQYFISRSAADFSWFVHLGEMVGFVLLLALPRRLVSFRQAGGFVDKGKLSRLVSSQLDAKLIHSLVTLVTETSPQQYYQELTRLLAQWTKADFCLLMIPPKTGEQLIIPVGYDQSQDKIMEGFAADGHKMPSLVEALRNGTSLCLTGKNINSEVWTLADELGMKQAAQLLVVPFHPKRTNAVMSIAILSKLSDPSWNEEDAQEFKEITETIISDLGQSSIGTGQRTDQVEMMTKLQRAQAYTDQVRLEYAQLKAKYDSVSAQEKGSDSQSVSMAAFVENQKTLQDSVTRLEARNHELESLMTKGRPSMEEVEQLRQELRAALTDLARIPSTLSKSDQKMLEIQLAAVKHLDEMQPDELITSIAQEFRQPLSSIVGYTDLLLGESIGLLGAIQRKFLERVKASTERLGILLNELVQVMTIDGGKVDQTPVSVNLKPVVDEAISTITAQIREKNITMQVDLPEILPEIQANKDALLHILANLLENACLVTPAEGKIKLFATVEQRENEPKFMHISVTDQGGGIKKADLPRVFSRRYKVENPQIQGIGDTGVGLSIVKSLVELHKGRVWVDTQQGVGSTFSVLLPLTEIQPNQLNPSISTS